MLYRHAKAEHLLDIQKNIVKNHAQNVVRNPNFTPERIRRFVKESLPRLSEQIAESKIDNDILMHEVSEAINNPTDRMIKAYDKLPLGHKWFLAAVVATEDSSVGIGQLCSEIRKTYEHYRSDTTDWASSDEIIDEMTEAFIKKSNLFSYANQQDCIISWIHPSYRDLVIDKISQDHEISKRLLQLATEDIIRLAISDAGGAEGTRVLPLLVSDEHWHIFETRCLVIIQQIRKDILITGLLNSFYSAYSNSQKTDVKRKIELVAKKVLDGLIVKWDRDNIILSPHLLRAYYQLSIIVRPLPPSPDLRHSWESAVSKFQNVLEQSEDDNSIETYQFNNWIELIDIIGANEPRFLVSQSFPDMHIERWYNKIRQ
jgi:hypothetical protein